jgi:type IV secretion system protein VirD4
VKYLRLGGYLFVGYVVGNIIADLVVGVAIPTWRNHLGQTMLILLFGGAGAFGGWTSWRLKHSSAQSDVHGSARGATDRQIRAALGRANGLIVGREPKRGGQLLRYDGPAHLMTIAPTRSGKGVGAIIPNLLTANRAIVCVDPKGENARVAARARRQFGQVHVLDPFEITGEPTAAYNPLDLLNANSPDLVEDAALLADALVYDPPAHVGEAHWNEEAKALIAGLILHIVCNREPDQRTLPEVRNLLTASPQEFAATLAEMQASLAADGLVRRAANRHLGKSDREATGVLSSAQRHTHFLDSARVNRSIARSDFRFCDLKSEVSTVFLVLPPERLETHARWLRLLVVQALQDIAGTPGNGGAPVLFLLDEFAALGRLEPIERAFGYMAGYGVQLWPILQDMHQLWSTYGERAGTFLSNAGLVQVFNVADIETANWVSRSIGATTVAYETSGASTSRAPNQFFSTHSTSTTTHLARRDLITPDEIMRLDQSLEILLQPGLPPIWAWKVRHFADPEFAELLAR